MIIVRMICGKVSFRSFTSQHTQKSCDILFKYEMNKAKEIHHVNWLSHIMYKNNSTMDTMNNKSNTVYVCVCVSVHTHKHIVCVCVYMLMHSLIFIYFHRPFKYLPIVVWLIIILTFYYLYSWKAFQKVVFQLVLQFPSK